MENQEKQDKISAKTKDIFSQLGGFTYEEIRSIGYAIATQAGELGLSFLHST